MTEKDYTYDKKDNPKRSSNTNHEKPVKSLNTNELPPLVYKVRNSSEVQLGYFDTRLNK